MNALHEQFIAEARDLVQQATEDLIAAERDGLSVERVDRVLRAFHTLKGSAGVVDLPEMGLTLHAAEDLFAEVQAGRLGATSVVIDQALACLDQVSRWVDDFEAGEALPPRAGEDAAAMAARLRALLPESAARSRRAPGSGAPAAGRCAAGLGLPPRRNAARAYPRPAGRPSDQLGGVFLRAACRLFFQRRRSARADAASARPVGVARGGARPMAAVGRHGSVCLQSAPAGHLGRHPCRACRHLPPGPGSGAIPGRGFGRVAAAAGRSRRCRCD